jgi:hypothetical protein
MQHDRSIERRHSWNTELRERFQRLEDRWNRTFPAIAIDGEQAELPTDDSGSGLGIPDGARFTFEARRPNVLIVGSGSNLDRVMHRLLRSCPRPIVAASSSPFRLPTGDVGTLVVLNAEHLCPTDQQALHAWLTCARPKPQVFTTTAVPLFPSVVRGTFNDALFYRLHEMCLMVRDAGPAQTTRSGKSSAGVLHA